MSESLSDVEPPPKWSLPTGNKNVHLTLDYFDFLPTMYPDQHPIPVMRYTWCTRNRMSVQLINYGSTITSIKVPNCKGHVQDIIMGFDDIYSYLDDQNKYFGATLGRVADFVKCSRYWHKQQVFPLSVNQPPHHFNGGWYGFDKNLWEHHNDGAKVTMSLVSRANSEGYPGNLIVNISYEVTAANCLIVDMSASTDAVCPLNLSNELFFNLAGHGAGPGMNYKHIITINAECYTPLNKKFIPTGEVHHVGGTVLDFRVPRTLGIMMKKINDGYNHNMCLKDCSDDRILSAAKVYHPDTGRIMEIYTDQPCLRFHTANLLPKSASGGLEDDKIDADFAETGSKLAKKIKASQTERGSYAKQFGEIIDESEELKSETQKDLESPLVPSATGEQNVVTEGTKGQSVKAGGRQQQANAEEKTVLSMGADHDLHGDLTRHADHGRPMEQKRGATGLTSLTGEPLQPLPRGVPCTQQCPCALPKDAGQKLQETTEFLEGGTFPGGAKDGTFTSGAQSAGQRGEFTRDVKRRVEGAEGDEGFDGAEGSISKRDRTGDKTAGGKKSTDIQDEVVDARKQWTDDWGDEDLASTDRMKSISGKAGIPGQDARVTTFSTTKELRGKHGAKYVKHGAFVMQSQSYPNAPNQKNFPAIWLRPFEDYKHRIIYKFGIKFKPDEEPSVLQAGTQTEDVLTITSSFSSTCLAAQFD